MFQKRPMKLVRKTARPKMLSRADSKGNNGLQRLLSLEVTPTTPLGIISRAFDNFALERILSHKRILSREEFRLLIEKFKPHVRTALKNRNLEIEKAQTKGRPSLAVSYRKMNMTDGVKPVKKAHGAVSKIRRKAGKIPQENPSPGFNQDYRLHSAWRKRKK